MLPLPRFWIYPSLTLLLAGGIRSSGEASLPQSDPSSQPAVSEREKKPEPEHDHSATAHKSFQDIEQWVRIFEDPAREEWQQPRKVVEGLGIGDGSVVADLGAGTGYFTVLLARAVAPSGVVLAVDTETEMVQYIAQRVQEESISNVIPVLALPDDPMLPANRVDLIFVCDTLHHIDDRVEYLRRLRKDLSPAGRIAVVDFLKKDLPVGPKPDHKLSREHVLAEFLEAGYELTEEKDFLPYQYFLIFRPSR